MTELKYKIVAYLMILVLDIAFSLVVKIIAGWKGVLLTHISVGGIMFFAYWIIIFLGG